MAPVHPELAAAGGAGDEEVGLDLRPFPAAQRLYRGEYHRVARIFEAFAQLFLGHGFLRLGVLVFGVSGI